MPTLIKRLTCKIRGHKYEGYYIMPFKYKGMVAKGWESMDDRKDDMCQRCKLWRSDVEHQPDAGGKD